MRIVLLGGRADVADRVAAMMTLSIYAIALIASGCAASEHRNEPHETTAVLPERETIASAYQASYDKEATFDFALALESIDSLPLPERSTYIAELRRGWLLHRLGHDDVAALAYRRAAALEPSSIEARLGLLAPLVFLEHWQELENAAREVLDRDPENYLATARLALAQRRLKRFAEAEMTYHRLVLRYPADVDVRAELGWTHLEMGRARDAARAFAAVLTIAPRHPRALEGARVQIDGPSR